MTTDEKRIAVAEWMGWVNIHFGYPQKGFETNNRNMKEWVGNDPVDQFLLPIPPLTLDWLHECEKKLSPDEWDRYEDEIIRLTSTSKQRRISATKEQRLSALVETLGLGKGRE